jgi:hypothetical protein
MGMGLGTLGSRFGRLGNAPSKGVGGPQIVLSASSQTENTTIGTTIGTLSVVGGTGTWTFSKTADPDSAFTLTSGALKNAIVFNYETKTSYSVTIQATNGTLTINRTITISVTNVLEVTLNALSIDDNTAVAGDAWSATITGKTSGSTITATSSDGTVLTVVGTTVSGVFTVAGTPTITLHETHPDATARDTGIGITTSWAVTLNALTLDYSHIVSLSALGTLVGTLSGKTSGSTLSLVDTAGSRFALDGLDVKAGSVATNYGSATSHNITVRETRPYAATRDTVLAVTVDAITFDVSFSGDVAMSTNSAGTIYWMITASASASAADIIAHTGAITSGYGTIDTVDGAASVTLPALGTGDRYFHAVLCSAGTSTAISSTDYAQIQSTVTSSKAFLGAAFDDSGWHYSTQSIDIGSAAADRYILVAVGVQNSDTDPTVTVGGVSLTKLGGGDFSSTTDVAWYGGLVTTGTGAQNLVVTWASAAYEVKLSAAWKMLGLISTTPRVTPVRSTSSSLSIAAGAGEFLFYAMNGIGSIIGTLAAATEAPGREAAVTPSGSGGVGYTADWTVVATNAGFTIPQNDVNSTGHAGVAITFK